MDERVDPRANIRLWIIKTPPLLFDSVVRSEGLLVSRGLYCPSPFPLGPGQFARFESYSRFPKSNFSLGAD